MTAAQPITNAVLQGYNGTIFAYGQTSSGKTFTMTGDPTDLENDIRGIIPRTVDALFEGIQAADESTEFTLAVQYVEIYMERVRDLLDPDLVDANNGNRRQSNGFGDSNYKNNLPITEDSNGVPGVPGAEKVSQKNSNGTVKKCSGSLFIKIRFYFYIISYLLSLQHFSFFKIYRMQMFSYFSTCSLFV